GHCQVGRRVVRAGPLLLIDELRTAWHAGFVAPAHDQRLDQMLAFRARVEEGGAFRGAEPLVTVARVEVCAERLHVERDLADGMRAIDDAKNPGGAGAAA